MRDINYKIYGITDAIKKLRPDALFSITDDDYENIDWNVQNNQSKPTPEEINIEIQKMNDQEPMRLLRLERDRRLSEVDWIVIRATSQGVPLSQEWIDYMQALRDLPTTATPEINEYGELINVIWPERPNG